MLEKKKKKVSSWSLVKRKVLWGEVREIARA